MSDPLPARLTGVKELLEGPSGTGKTFALGTMVEWAARNNTQVFILFTEQGLETLLGFWADHGKPVPSNLHWKVMGSRPLSLKQITTAAENVGRLSYESITKMVDSERSANNEFHKILSACSDFVDDRTGEHFGAVDGWGTDRVFGIDGLTELSTAAMKMVIGSKPTASMPDYGVAQNNLMNFLRLLTQGCACHFVLLAHVSREKNEITGGVKLMTNAIGSAISGLIPPMFSDVIYASREGAKFTWDTASMEVDVKTRNLPIKAGITPDFGQIMDKWQARHKATAEVR